MVKTTVYLPEDLDTRLNAEAESTGVSKAELIRKGVTLVLQQSSRAGDTQPLPVFDSGRRLTPDEMDELISEHAAIRATRR